MRAADSHKKKGRGQKEYDYFIKVVVVGKSGVGKSALMLRFCEGTYNETHVNTIGVDFRFKTFEVLGKKVKLQIWDTAGQEKFRSISSAYYRGADAVMLVYDITCAQSLEDLKTYWVQEVEKHGMEIPTLLLVGNKVDLKDRREVPDFKEQYYPLSFGNLHKNAKIYQVSAKNDIGVNQIFQDLAIRHIQVKEAKKGGKSTMMKSTIKELAQIEEEEGENSGSNSFSSAGERAKKLKSIHLESHVESPQNSHKLTLSGHHHRQNNKAEDGGCSC